MLPREGKGKCGWASFEGKIPTRKHEADEEHEKAENLEDFLPRSETPFGNEAKASAGESSPPPLRQHGDICIVIS
jgi:hypothetical protein